MKLTRQLPIQSNRDAWVEINLGALERNAMALRKWLPEPLSLMAVIKADAYGHGAVMCVPTLEASGVSMVGVASIDEGVQLRKAGLKLPILVLGASPHWAISQAEAYQIQLTIFADHHLEALKQYKPKKPLPIHIKVDTGMHRIGISWERATAFIEACQAEPSLAVVGVFTHLACGDDARVNQLQFDRWQAVLDGLTVKPKLRHVANTPGTLITPVDALKAQANMVRLGIACYGYSGHDIAVPFPLEPVMGLKARIIHIQDIPAGEGISYGHRYQTSTPMRIATLPLGYADGVPRGLSNKIHGVLHGQAVQQVGTITMDQMMVDITEIENAQLGEAVTLLANHAEPNTMTLSDWAPLLNTIEYELMCGLRVRLPRTYVRI